jgi:ATP-dependent helicase/nuclease subunit A
MNAPVPIAIRRVQIEASDPAVSAFVAANAGSGKTHVLAHRVIRLLLDGVDPAKILCLTFTKAAAANMAHRVFGQLGDWTALDDTALDERIEEISGTKPDPAKRALARRLFALALETPGGLKVQTIHAFCTQLLHVFPFEANVAARFSVLDESDENTLLEDLSLAVLLEGAGVADSAVGRAIARAITAAADQTVKELINEAIGERDAVEAWIARAGSLDAAIAGLSRALGISPNDNGESLDDEIFSASLIAESEWPTILAILAEGSDNDQKQMRRLAEAQEATGGERINAYRSIFCTAEPELAPRKSIVTGTIAKKYPDLGNRLKAEQTRICELLARKRAVACRDRTGALLTIVSAVLSRYRAEKDRRGLLDYDDLIDKTLALFDDVAASWVHYKLDLGIDHLLIDEAQDTSPKQWDIITKLVAEFTAGAGARTMTRTLFAVGDEKQSIFSFQGAAPALFAEMRKYFQRLHDNAELSFLPRELKHSFRSGASVLGAVDKVFGRPEAFEGLSADPVATVHEALPDKTPGVVEIWPLFKADEKRQIEAWDAPFDTVTETSPQVRLAQRIAGAVAIWNQQGRKPGDVLILVRQRGALFEAIIRALKEKRVAVAGADRLVLTEHIAVMDLMVLADALLLPDDDLALATVLKSPLFGLDDDHLFALAWNRPGSLYRALHTRNDPPFAEAAARFDRMTQAARRATPFAFYAQVLGADQGRRKILARLGPEAADPLDEFLNLALDYENREAPSLQGFVAWLRAARAEVKRDMEITRDEVRVMTVHGAKGLEAPIVIIADTTTKPTGPRDPRLLALPAGDLIWAGRQDDDTGPLSPARERARRAARDEYRRLLYVAMTRASERLIVAGYEGVQKRPAGCWYDLVCDALSPLAVEEPGDDAQPVLRFRQPGPEPAKAEQTRATEPKAIALPAWLVRDAPAASLPASSITPSAAIEDQPRRRGDNRKALLRGRLLHRLMQSLPDIPPQRRAEAVRRHLARAGKDLHDAERENLAAEVVAVLDDARFAPLFAPGSRAEVPIVGRVARACASPLLVSGQVDRLAVTAEEVLIGDYKTNHPAPQCVEDVPPYYTRQLALYRAVLAILYPDRAIRAALVWTEVPDLMEIPAAALDKALAQLTSA